MKTFQDVYSFPLHRAKYGSWVYDKNSHFVFEFLFRDNDMRNMFLDVINSKEIFSNKELTFHHTKGIIYNNKNQEFILIRGWGNLTGTGGMNLKPEEAANIQDTFAEFIVEKLNYRNEQIT